VAVLLLVAAALVALGLRGTDAPAAGPDAATLRTPLWSVRRLPQPVVDAVGAQHLDAALTARVDGSDACTTVRDPAAGDVTTLGADRALVPASTMKLLTAVAAFATLGPRFHYTTDVVAGAPVRNGNVERLYLVGGGDPLLATPERIATDARDPEHAGLATTPLATLADRIVAAGVRSVPGGIAGVDDRYDRTRYLDVWPVADRPEVGPVGALTVNRGGAGAAGTGAKVDDPAVNAAAELGRLLTARGVRVGAASRADRAPDGARPVASIDSPPLGDVLTELLSASDNLTAEMLVRELGAKAGTPTTAAGITAMRAALERLRVDLTGATIVDGSGLSRQDRLRCATLLQVVELLDGPRFAPVRAGLSIAGERGTLGPRLRGTPLAGNLTAKTGSLAGVSGLAGFVRSDRPLLFALLVNGGFGRAGADAVREAMATEIAAYPRVTDASGLVPAPFAPVPG